MVHKFGDGGRDRLIDNGQDANFCAADRTYEMKFIDRLLAYTQQYMLNHWQFSEKNQNPAKFV